MSDQEKTDRQDFVDNKIFDLLGELSGAWFSWEWDISRIGKVRDAVRSVVVDDLMIMTAEEFYPSFDDCEDGRENIDEHAR